MNGIDCATALTAKSATALKSAGISAVGRYLGGNYALTQDEVKAIHGADLALWLIYESSPTYAKYFTYSQGVSDADQAAKCAVSLDVPNGVSIYFAVDYDAQRGDMGSILDYFSGVRDGLGSKYLLGVYGSYAVMQAVKADRYYQTCAWSYGQKADCHIYQYKNDTNLAGVNVDLDSINDGAGLWEANDLKLDYLVLCYGDADLQIAGDLAQSLKCPVVWAADVNPGLLACATTKYQVGGDSAPDGVILLGGKDRLDTMLSVLKVMGKVQ